MQAQKDSKIRAQAATALSTEKKGDKSKAKQSSSFQKANCTERCDGKRQTYLARLG